ncbi:MAG: class I SAM-dependent methyltransferase [Bacteroidota bacterium]
MTQYYGRIAASYVLGKYQSQIPARLNNKSLKDLGDDNIEFLLDIGKKKDDSFFMFKRSMIVPRISCVLGFLHSLEFSTILDIGSGRGNFIFPFMEEFSHVKIISADIQQEKVDIFNSINKGGIKSIQGTNQDATNLNFENNSFDVVTALEVLEHIQNAKKAFNELIRVAKEYIIISVPSKEDDNPEHIHLFTKEVFIGWITENNSLTYKMKEVKDHLIIIVKKLHQNVR